MLKLELGNTAKMAKRGWMTLDICLENKTFLDNTVWVKWKAPSPIPLEDLTVSIIYTSHFLEHLYWDDAIRVLQESFRVLKNGASMKVCLPNAERIIHGYVVRHPGCFDFAKSPCQSTFVLKEEEEITYKVDLISPINGKASTVSDIREALENQSNTRVKKVNPPLQIFSHIDAISHYLLSHDHKQLYDFEKLSKQAKFVGFSQCNKRPFESEIDNENQRFESFYATLIK